MDNVTVSNPRLDLGRRLRVMRGSLNYSLADVSNATGLSISFLSRVETGKSDITFHRLMRIASHYGVTVAELCGDGASRQQHVVRAETGQKVSSAEDGLDAYLVSPSGATMLAVVAVYDPTGNRSEATSHIGEEFVHVLQGTIVIDFTDDETLTLLEGDSAYYDASRPHLVRACGPEPARILSVSTPKW